MKVLNNLPALIKILGSLPPLAPMKRVMTQARNLGEVETERAAILAATDKWGKTLMRKFRVDLRVEGRENLPTEGPLVYVSNHQGFVDIPVLCAVLDKVQFGFVAKDDLGSIPFYGDWMKRIRSVMIQRDDPRESLKAIAQGVEYIEQGFSLLIFPEGTRALDGPMGEFKAGALKLATKPGVPIVPISIHGTYRAFEETGVFLCDQTIGVKIHPAVPTAGLSRQEEKALTEQIHEIVAAGLEELKEEIDG